jgi:hypothetical protein
MFCPSLLAAISSMPALYLRFPEIQQIVAIETASFLKVFFLYVPTTPENTG